MNICDSLLDENLTCLNDLSDALHVYNSLLLMARSRSKSGVYNALLLEEGPTIGIRSLIIAAGNLVSLSV